MAAGSPLLGITRHTVSSKGRGVFLSAQFLVRAQKSEVSICRENIRKKPEPQSRVALAPVKPAPDRRKVSSDRRSPFQNVQLPKVVTLFGGWV